MDGHYLTHTTTNQNSAAIMEDKQCHHTKECMDEEGIKEDIDEEGYGRWRRFLLLLIIIIIIIK